MIINRKINSRYSFEAEDDWGDYDNGNYRKPWFNKDGYSRKNYYCEDNEWHSVLEHVAKWIYFNGEIPEGYEIDHIIPISDGGTNKLSNLRLSTRKDNNNNPFTKINNSKARINGKKSRRIIQTTKNGEVIEWPSISEAVRHGYSHNCIVLCCQGKREKHRDSKWSYEC